MKRFPNRKAEAFELEKPIPGCMGRMVNLFDLSTIVTSNRLLTEKPHSDPECLIHPKGLNGAKNDLDSIGDKMPMDKPVTHEMRESQGQKLHGTPMKMLIAQEMLKETESRREPPNVVARLMGLDTLPDQQAMSSAQRMPKEDIKKSSTRQSTKMRQRQPDKDLFNSDRHYDVHSSQAHRQEQKDYKDVYEVWQHSSRYNYLENQGLHTERFMKGSNEKKMALVRQKFIEAKHLATDEKLRQSKEFHDALEILSSNKDMFLKCLQEPNSSLSKQIAELHSTSPPPQTKRITVLRPSKVVDLNRFHAQEALCEKSILKHRIVDDNVLNMKRSNSTANFPHQKPEISSHPTRIVVLKPSPGKAQDIKTISSCTTGRTQSNGDLGDSGMEESREVAKEITRQMRESLMYNQRDASFRTSAFSNGYIGDESSFNRSENEDGEEESISSSEAMTPTSRHSWDHINGYGSPYSSSSFNRQSPDSSVCREAKKRLSERWALVSSTGNGKEQRQLQRSSSTLGEMLALPDSKTPISSNQEDWSGGINDSSIKIYGRDPDLRECLSYSLSNTNESDTDAGAFKNLSRSRSVPVSSTAYEKTRLNVEVQDSNILNPKEIPRQNSGKLMFKEKFSSLFSKSKKLNKEKCPPLPQTEAESKKTNVKMEGPSADSSCETSTSSMYVEQRSGILSSKVVFSLSNHGENQDQPSPVSILEAPFDDDLKPEVITKPSIVSISRSLSWEELSSDIASRKSYQLSDFSTSPEEENEHFLLVQKLLTDAGLDKENFESLSIRYHSNEGPLLDPALLERFISRKEEKVKYCEWKRRQRISNTMLLFDCINECLTTISITPTGAMSSWCNLSGVHKKVSSDTTLTEQVWHQVRGWYSTKPKIFSDESSYSMAVDKVIRNEVVGRSWVDRMDLEIDWISIQLEGEMWKELMDDALVALILPAH